jgi:hypothetical protein
MAIIMIAITTGMVQAGIMATIIMMLHLIIHGADVTTAAHITIVTVITIGTIKSIERAGAQRDTLS